MAIFTLGLPLDLIFATQVPDIVLIDESHTSFDLWPEANSFIGWQEEALPFVQGLVGLVEQINVVAAFWSHQDAPLVLECALGAPCKRPCSLAVLQVFLSLFAHEFDLLAEELELTVLEHWNNLLHDVFVFLKLDLDLFLQILWH